MTVVATRRVRVDTLLVERGLADSRTRAQAMILAGEVHIEGLRAEKAGARVAPDARVEVHARRPTYVSRGGYKLDHALTTFAIDVTDRAAADVGASTGGFTDCLLRRGARLVYAIDVGTGQLAWDLRRDARVVSLERRDVRTLTVEELGNQVDLATVDVAFISLMRVMPAVIQLVRSQGPIIALLKPQFEVGPRLAKGGVVRDPAVHQATLTQAIAKLTALGLTVKAATASPLAGPEGNLEFFLHLANAPGQSAAIDVEEVVISAHATVRQRGKRPSPVADPR